MKKNSERLTRGEEEVMQILWSLGQACCNDIIARFPDPKPKYTTVATFIKILENKGFVSHRQVGKGYIYTPLVGKEQYARRMMKSMLTDYFDGSFARLVSFFSESDDISVEETDEIIGIAENLKNRGGGRGNPARTARQRNRDFNDLKVFKGPKSKNRSDYLWQSHVFL